MTTNEIASKLSMFNFITLDGYYKDANEDISWHKHGEEEVEYSAESLQAGNILLFGRFTYQMLESFWTTKTAFENLPVIADGMNNSDKIVFSTTLEKAEWKNTRLIKNNMIEEIKKMKTSAGKNMTVLGSGSIITQLAEHNLIDEYQIMIDPVAIGNGTSIFKNMKQPLNLKLLSTRTLKTESFFLPMNHLKKTQTKKSFFKSKKINK